VKIVTMCVLALTAAGCGPVPPKRPGREMVPLSLVQAGFEREECRYENRPDENPLFRRGFGVPSGAGESPSPSPVAEDWDRSLPRQVHCGGPDGLIRRCDDGEES
jgi:hypothetical protein